MTTLSPIEDRAVVMEREAWLAAHHAPDKLSASQVAAVVGQDPYKSAFTLFQQKIGAIPWEDETRAMTEGKHMEPLLARYFAEDTGREVRDPGDYTIWTHAEFPWLFATPDRIQICARGEGSVELKKTEAFTKAWECYRDGDMPMSVKVQCQMQMACIQLEYGSAYAKFGREYQYFDIDRHEAAIQAILAECERFMDRLASGTPPPADTSAGTLATLKALHPDDSGETIYLPDDALEWVNDLDAGKDYAKKADEIKKAAEVKLREAMGAATFGVLPDGRRVTMKTTERAGYEVAACKYRALRITKAKEEG